MTEFSLLYSLLKFNNNNNNNRLLLIIFNIQAVLFKYRKMKYFCQWNWFISKFNFKFKKKVIF